VDFRRNQRYRFLYFLELYLDRRVLTVLIIYEAGVLMTAETKVATGPALLFRLGVQETVTPPTVSTVSPTNGSTGVSQILQLSPT
jgi:hypothetical protein